eukprot:1345026-Alexandrium_andersonii.AAC.1
MSSGWAVLVRLARYLIQRQRCVYHFPWQDEGVAISTYVDADFAGCLHARRSTCGRVRARGQHAMK